MNNYFTLIYLTTELNAKLRNAIFTHAVTWRKNILDIFFESDGAETIKLMASTDRQKTALFPDGMTSSRKSNVTSFFETLEGKSVDRISLSDNDRLVSITFKDETTKLVFRLFGTDPNVLLVDEGVITESFKNPDKNIGQPEPESREPRPVPFSDTKGPLKKRVQRTWPLLPRPLIPRLIGHFDLEQKSDAEIEVFFNKAEDELRHNGEPSVIDGYQICLLPESFFNPDNRETFDSVNDAVRTAFFRDWSANRLENRQKDIREKVSRQISRLENLSKQASKASKNLERADEYEQSGHLLMAHAHLPAPESEVISLPALFSENPEEEINIQVKPGKSIAENAAWYYERKQKAERSWETAMEYAADVEQKLEDYRALQKKIEAADTAQKWREFMDDHKKHPLIDESADQSQQVRKAFRTTKAGKYEVWIGKNAKSNDELLRASHKEDIWLHARGVSGSHTVIRMNKNQHDPDMKLIHQVAAWAAFYSQARGAETVPVIWTRRKYVRKPKGAAAGAVVVDREKVVLVSPSEPKYDYL